MRYRDYNYVSIICGFVNSITPIFGERYEARLHREMIYEDAKKEEDEKTRKIVIARTAIRNMLKDPSSATFYSELIKTMAQCVVMLMQRIALEHTLEMKGICI